jgi:hypothetical protein
MVAAFLILGQVGLSPAELLHGEDAKVFEAGLLRYWSERKPESNTIYVIDRTISAFWEPVTQEGSSKKPIQTDEGCLALLKARNSVSASLSWWRPASKRLVLIPQEKRRRFGEGYQLRQYASLSLPGYSKSRDKAVFNLSFNWSMHHGVATVWLTKTKGQWRVSDTRTILFV